MPGVVSYIGCLRETASTTKEASQQIETFLDSQSEKWKKVVDTGFSLWYYK